MSTGNRKPFYRLTAALPAYVFLTLLDGGEEGEPCAVVIPSP